MKHKHVHHSIDNRLDSLERSLNQAVTQFEGSAIHAFRVKVKKLKAALTLLAAEDPQHSIHTKAGRAPLPRRLRRFYRMTGEIRNRQLQLERIKEYWKDREDPLPGIYTRRLETELAATIVRAGNYTAKKPPVMAAKENILAMTPNHLHRRSVKKFLQKRKATLAALLATPQPWKDSLFHSIRKTLKDLQYALHDLSPRILPQTPFFILVIPDAMEKKIRSLTEALGDYQDCCTILGLLGEKYLRGIPKGPERKALLGFKKHWQKEKDRCRKDIYPRLREAELFAPGRRIRNLSCCPAH